MVFVVWVASGYELVRSLREVDRRLEASRQDFQRGQDVLNTVRTNVLLGSIYLRDALIDRTPASQEDYRHALEQIQEEVDRVLPLYLPLIGSPLERQHWDGLQVELGHYWMSRDLAFVSDEPGSSCAS